MIYDRIVGQGTLSEPKGVPNPQYALPSTINWMRGLALLVKDKDVNFTTATHFYSAIGKKALTTHQENTIFEQLIFAIHQVSALEALRGVDCRSDVARIPIVAWYYGVYSAASSMIAAQDGSHQEDHSGTARVWDHQFPERQLVMAPFDLRLSTLVKKLADAEVEALRNGSKHLLIHTPDDLSEAYGATCAYLSGCASYFRWRTEEDVKRSKEFKALNVNDFRTKSAKELRDARLGKHSISFLHQAFRYRGKANYREALFLGYGRRTELELRNYVDDLASVLTGFVAMAGSFASKRVGAELWSEFLDTIENQRSFSLSPKSVWG